MKTTLAGVDLLMSLHRVCRRGLLVALLVGLLAGRARAVNLLPGTNYLAYLPLDSWSFADTNGWTSDDGYAPWSFTNLASSNLGDGSVLAVDNPGGAAWLQFGITNADGSTNLTVDVGSVMFWYAPNWSGTNLGGDGPQVWSRLLEAGGYTPDSSFGWWSLYVDPPGQNIYFSAQTNDFSSNLCTYVTAPVLFTTNFWHFIAFTYSTTNTALYLDGELATNGPPLTNYPGPAALANGFFIGSDSNGLNQAGGMIDDLYTYDYPVSPHGVANTFLMQSIFYYGNFLNQPELSSAPSQPALGSGTPEVITGSGYLQTLGTNAVQITSTNVWMTNMVATNLGGGIMYLRFTIEGGTSNANYDVFATGTLTTNNATVWSWMGQGPHWVNYQLPITNSADCFVILGTPQDSDGDGVTDAYENLITHTSATNAMSNLDGLLDAWEAVLGLTALTNNVGDATKRANYSYTAADWLSGVTGLRNGSVSTDAEGNVTSVAQ